jgi:hypothetical protein
MPTLNKLPFAGLVLMWGVLASACSAISVSINTPSSVVVAPTPSPFPILYGSLGHVLTSDNWAGYVLSSNLPTQALPRRQPGRVTAINANNANSSANSGGTVSDIQAQWVISALTCGAPATYSAIWVGIDGETDGTVEQVGTGGDCLNGQAHYYAWFEIFPRPSQDLSQFPVNAGDTVSAEVKYSGGGVFNLTLQDLTSGQTFKINPTNAHALRQSAEWVVEAPADQHNQVLPLAPFSTVTFSKAQATINGQRCTINRCGWPHDSLVMESAATKIKAYPSPLGADGGSFSVAWRGS